MMARRKKELILVLRGIEHGEGAWRFELGDLLDKRPKDFPAEWLNGEVCTLAEVLEDGDG